jgi:ubiquinone/menaquinone biosynthesis C-methylase UbiE
MSAPKVDYGSLANAYDKGRSLSEANKILWLNLFKQHLDLNTTSRVLDIGCGTGRFSILIARQSRCAVVGIDPSPSMLAKAKAKCPNEVEWLLARAEAIPFWHHVFDVCIASQVVHHLEDKQQACKEIYRVLRHGGRVGVRYSSHAQLKAFLDYSFFLSALAIELQRVPDIPVLRELLWKAGFRKLEEHVVCQQFFESSSDYLRKLRNKYSSVLTLISNEEYHRGLEAAARYFAKHELKESDRYAEITFLVGIK